MKLVRHLNQKLSSLLIGKIPDTAYMVNVSRYKASHLCHDIYSHFWIPSTQKSDAEVLWKKFNENVYPNDDLELAIRTAFFLNELKSFIKKHDDCVFINIGSGFTSYQYLLDKKILTIEIDLSNIIRAKKKRAAQLLKTKIIPAQETIYIPCNLVNMKNRISAFEKVEEIIQGKKTFILCEGLFYYLPSELIEVIVGNCKNLQNEGSFFAFDYWTPKLRNSNIYKKLCAFFKREMNIDKSQINLFYPDKILANNMYKTILKTDVYKQEKKILKTTFLRSQKETLPEHYQTARRHMPAHNMGIAASGAGQTKFS